LAQKERNQQAIIAHPTVAVDYGSHAGIEDDHFSRLEIHLKGHQVIAVDALMNRMSDQIPPARGNSRFKRLPIGEELLYRYKLRRISSRRVQNSNPPQHDKDKILHYFTNADLLRPTGTSGKLFSSHSFCGIRKADYQ